MQSTVTFAKSPVSIEINGPAGSTDVETLPQWVTALSQGLTRWTYRGTDRTVDHWSLKLDNLPLEQCQALRSFFHDVARGPEETFTYTHTDGLSYTARFVDTQLQWSRESDELWSVSVRLEIADGHVNPATSTTTAA